jgi:adenylate cyclase class 2
MIFKKLGFREVRPIRKVREIYKKDDITASIDDVEGLGLFLELEKNIYNINEKDEALKELMEILKALNISRDNTIRKSYLELRG